MRWRTTIIMALVFALSLTAMPLLASAQTINWKFQDTYASTSLPSSKLSIPFIDWIQKVTNGRIKITRYEPGALASVGDTFEALGKGVFDAASIYSGFYTGRMPEGLVEQGLPWAWKDSKAHLTSLYEFGFFNLMQKTYEKHNLHLLATYTMGDVYNIGTVKPITKLEELKGMKIRAVGIYGDYIKALGATPVSIPFDEMYMALKLGTIDGYLGGVSALVAGKLGEVVHHYLLPSMNSVGFGVAVNKKSWDALPEDLKALLSNAAPQEANFVGLQHSAAADNSMVDAAKQYGVQFHYLSEEDQKAALKAALPIWETAAEKSPDCKAGVEIVKQTMKYFGRLE